MLNSAKHEILSDYKYQNAVPSMFSGFNNLRQLFDLLLNVKTTTIVGILTFISRIDFVLNWFQNENVL